MAMESAPQQQTKAKVSTRPNREHERGVCWCGIEHSVFGECLWANWNTDLHTIDRCHRKAIHNTYRCLHHTERTSELN